ncbi:glutamate racemase [Scardovia inopinata]|uniref:Glutamate racemase n=1 Tax=Scardovia inopinata F0304 TaxID=641146 RepID=W5IHD5_SCAIO|nr:glutamate racemase [Scardovia inopinata]EFG26267.1 glutamate racemase [Scardovia inopinata F0304]BAR07100.1 glutamate racemase [Scardovia inopinata JCM 12537]SUV51169.1 glutamate racemase [Scardovia inopinata]
MNNAPIGVFDSGMGGISVVRQIRQDLPHEDILFYGDSAHAPYGTKPTEQVKELSFAVTRHLLSRGVKAIVIACNTATSAAAPDLRSSLSLPVIGMEPALKVACDRGEGKPQNVLVLATSLTLREKKFARLVEQVRGNNTIHTQACPDLVSLVESGKVEDRDLAIKTITSYLKPYDLNSLDSVVLGCTHFIFYRNYFRQILPDSVAIIDGNAGTSHHVRTILEESGNLADRPDNYQGQVTLENSQNTKELDLLARHLLEAPLPR